MSTKLYVGNLSAGTTQDTLRDLFAGGGRHVERISGLNDPKTGQHRGSCLVQMSSPEEAIAAIAAVNGQEVDGNRLAVRAARLRRDREKS